MVLLPSSHNAREECKYSSCTRCPDCLGVFCNFLKHSRYASTTWCLVGFQLNYKRFNANKRHYFIGHLILHRQNTINIPITLKARPIYLVQLCIVVFSYKTSRYAKSSSMWNNLFLGNGTINFYITLKIRRLNF